MTIPAKATSSTQGEILLGGDFTGTADNPVLRLSGVAAGVYKLTKRVSVDSKGRVTSAGAMTQAEIDAIVDAGYATNPSAFTIVSGRPVLNTPTASASVAGIAKAYGAVITPGIASTTAFGVMKIGTGLKIGTDSAGMPSFTKLGSFTLGAGTDFQTPMWATFSSRHVAVSTSASLSSYGSFKSYYSSSLDGTGVWTQSTGVSMSGDNPNIVSDGVSKAIITTGTGECYVTNDSGQSWSLISGLVNQSQRNCAWNGSQFCIIGYSYSAPNYSVVAQFSSDGVTWGAGVTIASGLTSQPFALLSTYGAGSTFLAQVGSSTINLYTSTGGAWTNRGARPSTTTRYFGLSNGKALRAQPGILESSSDFTTWTYLYRSIDNGGSQPNDFTPYIPSYSVGYDSGGYMMNQYGMFQTDGTTIGSKITRHGFANRGLADATYFYFHAPTTTAGGSQSGVFWKVAKTEFSKTTYTEYDRAGLAIDKSSWLPSTGGTITSGTVRPTNQQTITKTMVSASAPWTTNSGGIDITAGYDSIVATEASYAAVARNNAAASSGSRVVQMYINANNEWMTSYTDDGVTWVSNKIATPTGASPRLVGMEWLPGAAKFVVIGKQTSAVESQNWTAYSSDGISWTFNFSPWTSSAYITSNLSYGFSSIIATGRNGTSLCSVRTTDGISWTLSGTALTPATTMGCTCMDTIAGHTAAMWTCTNATGPVATAVYYSTNGTTWTVVGNAVSGTSGGIYSASSDGPCMILTSSGVVYTGRSSGTGSMAVNIIYLNGSGTVTGSGINGYLVTMGGDSSTQPAMLYPDPSGEFYCTRGTSIQRYGTGTAYGSGNATYPLMLGSTYVFPAYGSNQPGRAGGVSTSLTDAATATALPMTTANKTIQNGPVQEMVLRIAAEAAGAIHHVTIGAGSDATIRVVTSAADSSYGPSGDVRDIPKGGQISLTAIRTSDSKWLFFGA